jgi:excisionase family DNA binding protein
MRTVYTTTQVAAVLKVSPRTVRDWFDSGKLRGYRVVGTRTRMIPRDHLLRFIKDRLPTMLTASGTILGEPATGEEDQGTLPSD